MTTTKAECIRQAINISSKKDFFKFDKKTFNAEKIKSNIEITSPKLFELMAKIEELDKNDMLKYHKNFKHIIYSDLRSSIAGIKLVASVFKAYGMNNIYDSNHKIIHHKNNNNFALLTSLSIYDKPFPLKLKKQILKIFNERPNNIYGDDIRFLLIDQGFKEGIDVYDVKYIHLVDDLITPSDQKQAIGRGTRKCGQKGLFFHPQLGWPLHVFRYKLKIDKDIYGEDDAFLLYIRESKIDIKKLYFAADLENICKFGAVDYEINKEIHEFGIENLNKNKENDDDIYKDLYKNVNNNFKLLKKAYKKFGGANIYLNKYLNFKDMREYVKLNFNNLKWSNLIFKNDCIKTLDNKNENKDKDNRIITLDNSQNFISNFFTSKSIYKGFLLWHSVGTGKTCSAISIASNSFEKDGYTIIWVTRHTLKSEIWKNIFSQVCSHTIREKIENGEDIPSDNVKAPLKFLNNRWVEPMSYKQFTNLIKGKNSFYNEMVKRNGKDDPFKKTLIIIDEAHKLYSEDVPLIERPDINALKKSLYHSYNTSKKDSCKLLLMTATPYTNDPMQLFKLLNLIKTDDYFDEDFDHFKDKYLDPITYKFKEGSNKEFLDKISGYISYLNREKDVRQFAYPIIYDIDIPMSTSNDMNKYDISFYKLLLDDVKDLSYINLDKSKEIVEILKLVSKKPKKTVSDIISQEEAFNTCLNKTDIKKEKKDKSDKNDYNIVKEFVKEMVNYFKQLEKIENY